MRSVISIYEDLDSDKYLLAEHYQKLLSFAPKDIEIINKLAALYEESGDKHRAFEYLQLAISLQSKSVKP